MDLIDSRAIGDRVVVIIAGNPSGGQWSFSSLVVSPTDTEMIDLKQIFNWGKVFPLLTPDDKFEVLPA